MDSYFAKFADRAQGPIDLVRAGPRSPTLTRRLGWTRKSIALLSALASSACWLAAPASAQQAGSSSPEASGDIVVTAQKRTERLRDVPISASVLGGSQLDAASFTGVTEALNTAPGIVATVPGAGTAGSATTLSVRGVAAFGAVFQGASPIGYYLDAVPFGLTRSAIAPDTDAFDLSRVEILRGPQGTLYGASAEGGLVRVLTNDPDLSRIQGKVRVSLSGTAGGGTNYRGDLALNLPIVTDKLAVRAVIGNEKNSGWIDSPIKPNFNGNEKQTYRAKVAARPTDTFAVDLSYWGSRDHGDGPSWANNLGRSASLSEQPYRNDFDAYSAKLSDQLPAFSITSTTSYLTFRGASDYDSSPGRPAATDLMIYSRFKSNVLSEEFIVSSNPGPAFRWNIGAIYRSEDDHAVQTSIALPAVVDFSDTSRSGAIFGEIGRQFFDKKLELTVGVRTFFDKQVTTQNRPYPTPTSLVPKQRNTYKATTPRVVLTWRPSSDVMVYASFSQGFRSGFAQSPVIAAAVPGFPDVKPDRLTNYEIGSKGTLFDRLVSYDAAVYYIKWKNVQEKFGISLSGLTANAPINGNSVSGLGAEGSLHIRPVRGLDLGANFSINNLVNDSAVFSSGNLLFSKGQRVQTPKYTAGGSVDYAFPLWSDGYIAHVSGQVNYNSAFSNPVQIGATRYVLSSDYVLISRFRLSVDTPINLNFSIFLDNANKYSGSITPPAAPGADCLNCARARPRTIGIQVAYQLN